MQKIIKRYICIAAILSTMIGYAQIQTTCWSGREYQILHIDGYSRLISTGKDCGEKLALNEVEKQRAAEAMAVAQNLISIGMVSIDTRAQIQSLDIKVLQTQLQQSQAAQYELEQSRQSLAQAQQKLDLAIQELNTALNIAAATRQIPNLGATNIAQAQAADFMSQAVRHAQQAAQQYAYATGQGNTSGTNSSSTTWYMDNDKDGWHSAAQGRATCPGPGWCNNTTKGIDCNDSDAAKTYNCSTATAVQSTIMPWFLDNDGDGYHLSVQTGTSKPTTPGNWTSTMTKGPDCNDNVFSANNSVCSVQIQGTNTSNPGKDYVPKSTDKLVKAGIVTTCDKQSTLGVCVLTSLEVTLNNVLGLTVTSKEINTAAYINTGDAYLILNGLNTAQTIQFINSFCDTEALTKKDCKTTIDAGKTFITDIKIGTIITPDKDFPDDRSKDKTTILSHSISVIGYDVDGNYI